MSTPAKSVFPGGLFLVLEGGEAVGKSTQAKAIAEWFTRQGYTVQSVGEPGGTEFGQDVRKLFLTHHQSLTPQAEVGILLAAKSQLLETVIRPALDRGEVVICDRYTDTLFAYQHYAKGHSAEMMEMMVSAFDCNFAAHLTLLFHCRPETALERVVERRKAGGEYNSLDAQKIDFYRRVTDGLMSRLSRRPVRDWRMVVTEDLTIEEVTAAAIYEINRYMTDTRKQRIPDHVGC